MTAAHTWVLLLLWIRTSTQDIIPDVHVTCAFSEDCVLPCSFQPAGNEVIKWLRQEAVVYSFRVGEDKRSEHEEVPGHASLFTNLVSQGNASLLLRGCGPRDRGRYRCQVNSTAGLHEAPVIVKVEAPIRSLALELSKQSGFEEIKCATRGVYPAPRITWSTDPPTSKGLQPITRKLADRQGLYAVDSRLKRPQDQSKLTYICQVDSSYGTRVWTASLKEREISWKEKRNLTIPCHAPSDLHNPSLSWSFTNHNKPVIIATHNSLSPQSLSSEPWRGHVVLDPSGDGSLRLIDPDSLEHTGIYTCVYSSPKSTYTELIHVNFSSVKGEERSAGESRWWIVALVVAVLVLALVGILGYLKIRSSQSKPRKSVEEESEMQPIRDTPAKTC